MVPGSEEGYAPLSALQHLIYCERQCALIHLEGVWIDNRRTAEGNVLHARVHEETGEGRPGLRIARGLPVASEALGLIGQCDVVEFHVGTGSHWRAIVPVEYKRGRSKSHEADRIQLCAQGLCLEEMLGQPVTKGALFYGESRRREVVELTPELRRATGEAARRLHGLLAGGVTPPGVYRAGVCRGCSLLEVCLPRRREALGQASVWFAERIERLLSEE
ncbi:MAG: CRISPR-associated protein Cas4 [Magnetococcales bacterium]|nr:CRISPR-associated protein Cas4 [Magnetococcales bacterium]